MTLIQQPFSSTTRVRCYQNVFFVDFTEAEDDGGGGDNWGYEMSKDPVKSSPSTNQHTTSYRPDDLPVTQPTVSKH